MDEFFTNQQYPSVEAKTGLVAFLDILGYKNLTMSTEKIAGIVFGVLRRAQYQKDIVASSVNPLGHCDEETLRACRGQMAICKTEFDKLLKSPPGDLEEAWEAKNAELREMGLPTVPMPEE